LCRSCARENRILAHGSCTRFVQHPVLAFPDHNQILSLSRPEPQGPRKRTFTPFAGASAERPGTEA
jgi:hypothetical protein